MPERDLAELAAQEVPALPPQVVSAIVVALVALVGGILSTVYLALPVNTFFFLLFGRLGALILVGPVEETSKMVGLIVLSLSFPYALAHIRNARVAMLLGGLAGAGFSFTENLSYALGLAGPIGPVGILVRSIVPLLLHIMLSAVAGVSVVMVAHTLSERPTLREFFSKWKAPAPLSFLLLAMFAHSFNDLALFFLPGILGLVIGFGTGAVIFYIVYKKVPSDLSVLVQLRNPVAILEAGFVHPSQTVVCQSCGGANLKGNIFCTKCGNRLTNTPVG